MQKALLVPLRKLPGIDFRSVLAGLTITLLILMSIPDQSATANEIQAPLQGRWSGSFVIGIEVSRHLVFNLQWSDGNYSATLDLPSQSMIAIPVDSIVLKGNELTMLIPAARAEFYGTLRWADAEQTRISHIDGDWSQVGEYVAVTLYPDSTSPIKGENTP